MFCCPVGHEIWRWWCSNKNNNNKNNNSQLIKLDQQYEYPYLAGGQLENEIEIEKKTSFNLYLCAHLIGPLWNGNYAYKNQMRNL